MWPNCRSERGRAERGFTLVEVLVALTVLVVVIVLSMSVLFAMQRFSQRQQVYVEPRQTARRGVDYLSYFIRNAGARVVKNSSGIVAWGTMPGAHQNDPVLAHQASFNNLDATQAAADYGDLGTDLITMILPSGDFSIPVKKYPGLGWGGAASHIVLSFNKGCNPALSLPQQNDANVAAFISECQCSYGELVSFFDDKGTTITAMIDPAPNAISSQCQQGTIDIAFNHGLAPFNPPGAYPELNCPTCWMGSMQFSCFRVHNRQLQQLMGAFDPLNVPDDSNWTPLLENVEDLQIAYIFEDGSIWNDDPGNRLPNPVSDGANYNAAMFAPYPAVSGGVPMPPPNTGGNAGIDPDNGITHLSGLRLTVVARSEAPVLLQRSNRYTKPVVEDGIAAGNDDFYHHRITATIMIRNQMLGF